MKKTLLAVSAIVVPLSPTAFADLVKDSQASLNLRNFYFNNDFRDKPGAAGQSKTEEWAQGFVFNFASGFTDGTVGVGLDAIGLMGVTLDSGAGRHRGSSMIPDDGAGAASEWSRFGLTPKMKFSKTELRYGSLLPKLPVLTYNDGRLLPQTFEGGQVTSSEIDGLTLTGGRLEHVTGRGSSDRTGLAVAGGSRESNEFLFAGGDYKLGKDLLAQYYFANMQDYYNQHFVGLTHTLPFADGQSFKTELRYFRTTSDGGNGSAAGRASGYRVSGYTEDGNGEIDNRTWSAAFTYSVQGHALMAGYQVVSDASNFVQPNQGSLAGKGAGGASVYLHTDRMLASFNRAGERTGFAQYSYDFAAAGVPGLKASLMYLKGDDIKRVGADDGSEWERDIGLDYVIQSGTFKGLGLAWRNGVLHSDIDPNQDQNRLILSYSLALF
ncbi:MULTISPECIES: OprD family porin [unclassified Pseudomonas]|uniref:OprD family porin n=1 Tax=Pseudomonas TaxID=286 RepID=UPI000D990495|nr:MULTISPECIES: OprD family porin [unclassified Pseudomonas]PYG81065.1 outer membrane OprD family porin [Pseudomonas sp. RV120224-01c]PYG84566.1 outer membrane OprD family porin [Pseudomonas sp. RV120224-01b]